MPDACIGVRLSEKIRGQQLLELGEDPLLLRLREVLRRERECSSCLIPGYCHPIRLKTSSFAHVLRPGIKNYAALGSQPADSTLVSSLALGPPPSVEKSLDAAA
jgi:hypothetical protein